MIWSLQVLRFVAAAMVVYVHAAQVAVTVTGSSGILPHHLAGLGLTGVDIFFVISGVVIARTAPGLTPAQFAWRRIRRIMPIYWLCCISAVAVALPSGITWRDLLATLLLWPATDEMTAPLLGVAWTLCFEMLFYACAALALIDRRIAYVLLGLYALALGSRSSAPLLQFLGNPLILEFLFGVVIARLPAWRPGIVALPLGLTLLIAAALLGLAPEGGTLGFLRGDGNLQRSFLIGIPAALTVYGAMHLSLKQSVWTYLGDASYTLYLTHTFAVTPLQALWTAYPVPPDLIIVIGMAASIMLAWRVHEMVERPLLRSIPTTRTSRA